MHVLYIMSLPRNECCADNEDDWDHLQKNKSNVANYQRLEPKAKNAESFQYRHSDINYEVCTM